MKKCIILRITSQQAIAYFRVSISINLFPLSDTTYKSLYTSMLNSFNNIAPYVQKLITDMSFFILYF